MLGRSMGRSVGRWVGRSAFHPTRASTCSRKHNQNITFTDCTCGHSRGIRGHFGWAFGGHSRAFAGIRGHSAPVRVIRPQEEMTKSLEFINTSLARAPPEPPRQKPKNLVEQTLYIILKAKLHNYWQGEGGAGAWRVAALRILPRWCFAVVSLECPRYMILLVHPHPLRSLLVILPLLMIMRLHHLATHRRIDASTDRPTDRPADRPIDRPADRPTDRPTDRPIG